MMPPEKKSWYVAQLKPNGFSKAQVNLIRQGFECFMPMRKVTTRHARKLSTALKPIFPGYIFIKFGLDNRDWRKINSTIGINKLISFRDGLPAQMPEVLIEGLLGRCDGKHILKSISDWKTGDKARMIAGPFALIEKDLPIIILDVDEEYREKNNNAFVEVTAREANVIRISDIEGECTIDKNSTFGGIVANVYIQLLSYLLSLRRGHNPDFPKNLAKVVTVE